MTLKQILREGYQPKQKRGRSTSGQFFGLHLKPTRIGSRIKKGRIVLSSKLPIYRETAEERRISKQAKQGVRAVEQFRKQRAEMVKLKHRKGVEAARVGLMEQRANMAEQKARIRLAQRAGRGISEANRKASAERFKGRARGAKREVSKWLSV